MSKTNMPGWYHRSMGGAVCRKDGGRVTGDNWIKGAVKPENKGKLHEKLGVPKGEKIPAAKLKKAEKSSSPKLRKEAQFAETMKGLRK